ncbi:MAG TPA: FtsX-like permease family protein, partial [Vicinamibacterales bacterium]|nr:FtsX-like permease family protein [Vicinamibacterales bacterium]
AADAVLSNPRQRRTRVVYMNFWQAGPSFQMYPTLLVRTRGNEAASTEALARVVQNEGHEYVSWTRTLVEQREASLVQERLLAALSTAFAVLGLALAAVGLYGLLRFSVAQRRSELGIRMALGAGRSQIRSLILRDAWMIVTVGTIVGAPAAWAASKVAAALLSGPPTLGAAPTAIAVALLFVVASVAAWLPARRATMVDPLVALRYE